MLYVLKWLLKWCLKRCLMYFEILSLLIIMILMNFVTPYSLIVIL